MIGRLVIDIEAPLDRFTLRLRWETERRSLGIFGHSGAGKTTILEILAGLRRVTRGLVQVDGDCWLDTSRGVDVPPQGRGVGYVPQDGLLFPHRDVLGNILFGRRRAARSGSGRVDPERVLEVLELRDLRESPIRFLSGGEKRRVSLGRALCSGAGLLLMDEPMAGLDAPLRGRILPYLLRVREEFRIPTILVSHDVTEIKVMSEEVIVLSAGEVIARGGPDETFSDPAVFPMARAGGFENVVRGRVIEAGDGIAEVAIEEGVSILVPGGGLAKGDTATIGLRAEDLILATEAPAGLSAQNVIPGRVRDIRHPAGLAESLVIVDPGHGRLGLVLLITPRAQSRLGLAPGMPVHVVFKVQACEVLAVT